VTSTNASVISAAAKPGEIDMTSSRI
jgi:hypothetical protein